MVRAIIIDDEKNALEVLSSQLLHYCPNVQVIKKCESGEEGISAINELNPDLIFLDIEMPKINGFDVLNQTAQKSYKVIFTTAYDQFAIKAFKYSTIDYLLKPIDIEELKQAIKKVTNDSEYHLNQKITSLFEHYGYHKPKANKIALPIGDGYEMIAFENIIRAESESNYTVIYLNDKRRVMVSKTLKEIEENLNDSQFFRIHNSHLINTEYINKFFKSDGGYVVLLDGTQINISRTKREEFYELLKKV
jgi:two-component system LytT family response regulator